MIFDSHKNNTNVKYVARTQVLKQWEDSDRQTHFFHGKREHKSQKADVSSWQATSLKPYVPACLASVKPCPGQCLI